MPYEEALAFMTERAAEIRSGERDANCVWLLEHPPLFTAGTSADPAELFNPQDFPGLRSRPRRALHLSWAGQRVAYVMLDLDKRGRDVRAVPDIQVVGEATSGEEAITQAEALHPDVILMDVNMPGVNGIEATRRILTRLTAHSYPCGDDVRG